MNVEPSRPARPSRRTRRSVRHLAVAGMLTISIAACSSDDSDSPTAAGTAAPTVLTTASARIETPSSTDAPARPAVTQAPNSSAPATRAPPSATDPEVATPLELVRGSQTSGADVELFRVTTDEPMYWRLATLPEFDGRTWRNPEERTVAHRRHRGLPTGRPHRSPAARDPGPAGAAGPRRRRPHAGRIPTPTSDSTPTRARS